MKKVYLVIILLENDVLLSVTAYSSRKKAEEVKKNIQDSGVECEVIVEEKEVF